MKKIIVLVCSIISFKALADFQLSPGANINLPFKSAEKNSLNLPYLKANAGLGVELNMQINLPLAFSLNLDGAYNFGAAKSQYNYLDTATGITATVADLDTSYYFLNTAASLRYHLLNLEHFKLFGGYGYLMGALSLAYLRSDFENKHSNSTAGFKQNDSASFTDPFWEAGCEYFWTKLDGLQLLGKFYKINTGRFATLNSSVITSSAVQVSLLYNHVVNWDFFWK